MRPLPPGLPPHIATHALNFQHSLEQQEALRRLASSQQNGASWQPPTDGLNRAGRVIARLRIAFAVFRLVAVAAVLWIMWHAFAPY